MFVVCVELLGFSVVVVSGELCIVLSWRRGVGIIKFEDLGFCFSYVDIYGV